MTEHDDIVGVRDHLGRIERKIDILADTVFTIGTVLAFVLAGLAIRELHFGSPLSWIIPPIAFVVIMITVAALRERYGRDTWMNHIK